MQPFKRTKFEEEILPIRPPQTGSSPPAVADPEQARAWGSAFNRRRDNPGAGIGLSSDAHVAEFAADFKQLQSDWSNLTADQRVQQIREIAEKQLRKEGVPTVIIQPQKTGGTNDGVFLYEDWTLFVDKDAVEARALTDGTARQIADSVYHESRHAEQWFLMARFRATELQAQGGSTPEEQAQRISDEMHLNIRIVSEAQKSPLIADSQEETFAQLLYKTVYIDATKRNLIIDKMHTDEAWYRLYRTLPEEVDAWECGDKVKRAMSRGRSWS